jgi:hypothetical protein
VCVAPVLRASCSRLLCRGCFHWLGCHPWARCCHERTTYSPPPHARAPSRSPLRPVEEQPSSSRTPVAERHPWPWSQRSSCSSVRSCGQHDPAGHLSERPALICGIRTTSVRRKFAAGLDAMVEAPGGGVPASRTIVHRARNGHNMLREVYTTNNPRVVDLGVCRGASDGNRTRALSLGIPWSWRSSPRSSR